MCSGHHNGRTRLSTVTFEKDCFQPNGDPAPIPRRVGRSAKGASPTTKQTLHPEQHEDRAGGTRRSAAAAHPTHHKPDSVGWDAAPKARVPPRRIPGCEARLEMAPV